MEDLDKYKRQALNSLKWYVPMSKEQIQEVAETTYWENVPVMEDDEREAAETFKRIFEQCAGITRKSYLKQLITEVEREIAHPMNSDQDTSEYKKAMHKLLKDTLKFIVYISDPSSREPETNPDRDVAIATLYARKTMLTIVYAIAIIGLIMVAGYVFSKDM